MYIDLIVYSAYLPIGIAAIFSVRNFKRLEMEFRALSIFIFISALAQGTSEVLAYHEMNNLPISHAYALLGFWPLMLFYRGILRPFIPNWWFAAMGYGFTLFAILNSIFWQPLNTFNSIALAAEALLLIIMSLSAFILSLNEEMNAHVLPKLKSLNLVNSGIFIYFSGNLILFYNGDVIMHAISTYWSKHTWLAPAVLTGILHTCLAIGLWKSPKK